MVVIVKIYMLIVGEGFLLIINFSKMACKLFYMNPLKNEREHTAPSVQH
jgi:hypothetical protein